MALSRLFFRFATSSKMSSPSELEVSGNLFTHPFAELLVEIGEHRLSGSLRLGVKEKKCIVYFRNGTAVFAASNMRSSRLYERLSARGRITSSDLAGIPNFSNDFELTSALVANGKLTQPEVDRLFAEQIDAIVIDLLTWDSGDWSFSPLARIREGLDFPLDLRTHLVNYSRCMPAEAVANRFRALDETFRLDVRSETAFDMTPVEAFVYSRLDENGLNARDLITLSSLPQQDALHALYTLWLAGLLIRDHWNPAFGKSFVTAMRSARLELKKEAKHIQAAAPPPKEEPPQPVPAPVEPAPVTEKVISLDEYLARVEGADTFYDILGVDPKAETDELKKAYFMLAKNFHPDRYHSAGGDTLKRIQSAFTELAQAHETLKNPSSREVYDYRVRKELAEREKREATGETGAQQVQREQAAENFERGYNLLMDNDPEAAAPFLARAAHFGPQNARHRAYYGRALSFDDKQRHKAEAELQAAIKLDPTNANFRLMLAEFFIKFNLMKRAEGELNRLLGIFPSNREARAMLESLKSRVG